MVAKPVSREQYAPGQHLADVLIKSVPPETRDQLLESLIDTLEPGDHANLELVTWLVMRSGNAEFLDGLKVKIDTSLRAGGLTGPISICTLYPDLAVTLLELMPASLSLRKTLSTPEHANEVKNYLSFCRATLSTSLVTDDTLIGVFLEGLDFLGSSNQDISRNANDLVSQILLSSDERLGKTLVVPISQRIWAKIVELCVDTKAGSTKSSTGCSLWLRSLSAGMHVPPRDSYTDEHWQLMLQGLRSGDSELRKICLAIVKLSTFEQPTISTVLQQQYARYCTVFETIVLGHYINQVIECEADLDFLASKECKLTPEWLYVLLASGIDPSMQESNRKFIGNWFMKTRLSPNDHFFHFVQHDFLPWAILGPIYVSSLKRSNGVLRCIHGERLAEMVEQITSSSDNSTTTRMADTIIDVLSRKKSSAFAYAIVYLVRGMRRSLIPEQKASIAELSLHRLPQVARDAIMNAIDLDAGIKKMSITASRRQELEQVAIAKCAGLPPDLSSLTDLWSNLQYLELPKDLLIQIPAAIFSPEMIKKAVTDPELGAALAGKMKLLHQYAENRAYLLAPLVIAIRHAFLACPDVLEILRVDQLIIGIARRPPRQSNDLLLEEAALELSGFRYEKYFGERPSLGFAAFFDLISRLSGHQRFIKSLLEELLLPWKSQKPQPPTVTVWKMALQLQIILLCCVQLEQNQEEARSLLDDLFQVLALEPLPRYRYLLEWMCTHLSLKYDLQDSVLTGLSTKDHHSNPKFLASLMKVGCILGCTPDTSEDFALQLAIVFVPLAASSKVVIRHEAQWQFPTLMDHARAQSWDSIAKNAAFLALDDYIRSLDRFSEPPAERILGRFDPSKESTLTNLVEGPWFGLDHTIAPHTTRENLLQLYASDDSGAQGQLPPSCLPLGAEIARAKESTATNVLDFIPSAPQTERPSSQSQDPLLALQTKGTAYLSRALQLPADSAPPSDPSLLPRSRQNVLVMASLVDNPYNLGGLSRVSEIFGAGALTLQNQNVVTNKDFRAVSVSSHLHIPIVQLSSPNAPNWLVERKEEGFTVVGIEQTDRSLVLGSSASIMLNSQEGSDEEKGELSGQVHKETANGSSKREGCPLPEKVVLVVGSEREGIPARVLVECDILVEIPQVGITRSLNVQTAVAIVLYEHARQWSGRSDHVT